MAKKTLRRYGAHTWFSLVHSGVRYLPLTKKIIKALMPYFPRGTVVTTGYLSERDQYWRVNFHWAYMQYVIKQANARDDVPKATKTALAKVVDQLWNNAPTRARNVNYISSKSLTADKSKLSTQVARWRLVNRCKLAMKQAVGKDKEANRAVRRVRGSWGMATARLARPGRSKHGCGYAVDIAGNRPLIRRVCRALGATVRYDEESHVHVEFGRGVIVPPSRAPLPGTRPSASHVALLGKTQGKDGLPPEILQAAIGDMSKLKQELRADLRKVMADMLRPGS